MRLFANSQWLCVTVGDTLHPHLEHTDEELMSLKVL